MSSVFIEYCSISCRFVSRGFAWTSLEGSSCLQLYCKLVEQCQPPSQLVLYSSCITFILNSVNSFYRGNSPNNDIFPDLSIL